MKKLIALLLMTTANAYAAPNCRELPTCESLGYVCSAEDCGELKTLSCPFDTSKKVCWPKEKECEVGDVLYNDLKCYNFGCGKTPIAVVFDTEKRLAVQLSKYPSTLWGGYGYNIEDLEDCTTNTVQTVCAIDGKSNTLKIINHGKNNNISYPAAENCYYSTYGGVQEGTWFLPSIREILSIKTNKDAIAASFAKEGLQFAAGIFWGSNETGVEYAIWTYKDSSGVGALSKEGNKYSAACVTQY